MADRIAVSFHGSGGGVAELTWGQKGIWQTMQQSGGAVTMGGIVPMGPDETVEDAAAMLRYVMSRHQSLRTRLRIDADGHARQHCVESGEAWLEVIDAGGADPATVADEVYLRYQVTPFDLVDEWPVRMAVVCADGVPTHSVGVYLHLSIDAHGMNALIADLSMMDKSGETPAPTALQPMDLARQQQSPAARRQCQASLRHLERVLRTISPRRFPERPQEQSPRYQLVGFRSPAALRAVTAIAARRGIETSPVLLAAYAVSIARVTGAHPVVVVLAVGNRFRPGFADIVSPVAQVSPCVLDVADISLDEAVGRAWHGAMMAYKHAYYDPALRRALIDRVNEERGTEVDISCFFNDRRQVGRDQVDARAPDAADLAEQITAALPATTVRWIEEPDLSKQKLYFDVNDGDGELDVTLSADTRYISTEDMIAIVRGMETVLVEAALDPAAPTGVRGAVVPA